MSELDDFRAETRAWLDSNCPPGARGPGPVSNGSSKIRIEDRDVQTSQQARAKSAWGPLAQNQHCLVPPIA